jgi:hypothetical protein
MARRTKHTAGTKKSPASRKLTKEQLKQLRNSPFLKRKLEEAKRVINSPEFKEFMRRNPLSRRQVKRPGLDWDGLVTVSTLGADFRDTQLRVSHLKNFIRKSRTRKNFVVKFLEISPSMLDVPGSTPLSKKASNKLVKLTKLYAQGARVHQSLNDFNSYLFGTPVKALGNKVPSKMILSEGNVERLRKELNKKDWL